MGCLQRISFDLLQEEKRWQKAGQEIYSRVLLILVCASSSPLYFVLLPVTENPFKSPILKVFAIPKLQEIEGRKEEACQKHCEQGYMVVAFAKVFLAPVNYMRGIKHS